MRWFAIVALSSLSVVAMCDDLITIPTGSKVPFGAVRFDVASAFGGGYGFASADYGIGKSFEATLRDFRPNEMSPVGTFDFSYNYLKPISGLVPGISVGVQDALSLTPDRRRFYVAVTSRDLYSTDGGDVQGDVTLGIFIGQHTSGFVGLNLPLSPYLRLLAEHNGYRISAGIEIRPVKHIGVRFIAVDGRPVVGLTTLTRF